MIADILTSFNQENALRCARSFEHWRTRALQALDQAKAEHCSIQRAGLLARARGCAENARWEWAELCKARARLSGAEFGGVAATNGHGRADGSADAAPPHEQARP